MPKRMSNEMRGILKDMDSARNTLNQAIKDKDVEKANEAKAEIENLNSLYDAAETAFENEMRMKIEPDDDPDDNGIADKPSDKIKYDAKLFYKAVTDRNSLTADERNVVAKATAEYKNRYSESSRDDGGYTVPDDLSTEIFESIKSKNSVRNLVHVEPVTSATGTRLGKQGTPNRLYNTEEYSEIKEMNNAKYDPVKYTQKKFAGLMPISSELLEDSFVNFKDEIVYWLSEAARITENRQLLYGAGGEKHCQGIISTVGAFKEVTSPSTLSIGYLRKVKFGINSGYHPTSQWIMNTDAFLEISELKDAEGKSYIQPDPTASEQYMLIGSHIYILDDIETEDGKTVVMYGDLDKAYRMFSRKEFGIAFTDVGAGAFETDTIKARGIERFDGKIMDNEALIIVRDFSVGTPLEITSSENDFGVEDSAITKESLAYQTKNSLIELADDLGIAGINNTMTKQAIINAIVTAQSAADTPETSKTPETPGTSTGTDSEESNG